MWAKMVKHKALAHPLWSYGVVYLMFSPLSINWSSCFTTRRQMMPPDCDNWATKRKIFFFCESIYLSLTIFSNFSFFGCSAAKIWLCWLKLHESSSICCSETLRDALLPFICWSAVDEKQMCVCVTEPSCAGEVCSPPLITQNQAFAEVWACLFSPPKTEQKKKKNTWRGSDCEMYFSDFFPPLSALLFLALSLALSRSLSL